MVNTSSVRRLAPQFLVLSLWLLPAVAALGASDLRLERKRFDQRFSGSDEKTSSQERVEVVFISENSARLDTGSKSAIVRVDDGVFLWVDHDAKAYAELALPLRMEALLTGEEKECLQSFPLALTDVQASVTVTGKQRTIKTWETTELRVEGQHPDGLRFEQDSWMTKDLPADLAPYHQLVRSRAALSLLWRGWIGRMIAEGGYPVESKATVRIRGNVRVSEKRLEKVTEIEFEESRYLPPAGYEPTLERPPIDVACANPNGPHRQR